MPYPKISVVVVVQNGERYLKESIQSILNQTLTPKEIIVVDGDSTDKTAAIAKSYFQVKYIQQNGKGLANARNTGIKLAIGELIAFCDYDDIWLPNKLSTQVECLIKNPKTKYNVCLLKFFKAKNFELPLEYKTLSFDEPKIAYTPSGLLAYKSLFNKIEFNPDFKIACDADWFCQTKLNQIPYQIIYQSLFYKRIHNSNLSKNKDLNRQELFIMIKHSLKQKRTIHV